MIKTDVVIIGAGLTGLTLGYLLKREGVEVTIIEKSDRYGGFIDTIIEAGFIYERGPNTLRIESKILEDFFTDLDIKPLEPNQNAKKRWILKSNNWIPLPASPIDFLTNKLFDFSDKLKLIKEPFTKSSPIEDESLGELVQRKFGKSFVDYALDPFISGIYAGDPYKLKVKYAFPKLQLAEKKYGSVMKGMMKEGKKKSESERVKKRIISFEGGLKTLTSELYNYVKDSVHLNTEPKINDEDGLIVSIGDENIKPRRIVSTVSLNQYSDLFAFLSEDDMPKVNYSSVANVVLGYKEWKGIDLKAFGGLVPAKEGKDVLGILFPSAIFKNRAPENGALLTVFIGGIRNKEIVSENDDKLKEIALKSVKELLGNSNAPDLIQIDRWKNSIPQYDSDYENFIDFKDMMSEKYPGLYLAGMINGGIGLPDRIKQAKTIAEEIKQGIENA